MPITIATVSPNRLPENGGTTIRVTGTNLDTVTKVTFNGKVLGTFNKLNNKTIEFGSPAFNTGAQANKSIVIILTDGVTSASTNTVFSITDNLQLGASAVAPVETYADKIRVNAYHNKTLQTSFTGEEAPWVQQVEIMELVDNKGDQVVLPTPVQAPLYDTSNSGNLGYGN